MQCSGLRPQVHESTIAVWAPSQNKDIRKMPVRIQRLPLPPNMQAPLSICAGLVPTQQVPPLEGIHTKKGVAINLLITPKINSRSLRKMTSLLIIQDWRKSHTSQCVTVHVVCVQCMCYHALYCVCVECSAPVHVFEVWGVGTRVMCDVSTRDMYRICIGL